MQEELVWVSLKGWGDQDELVRGTGLRAGAVHSGGKKSAGYILATTFVMIFGQSPNLFWAICKINKIIYVKMNCKLLYYFWSKDCWWWRGWWFPFSVSGSQGNFYGRGWGDGLFFSSPNKKSPWPLWQGCGEARLETEVLSALTDPQKGLTLNGLWLEELQRAAEALPLPLLPWQSPISRVGPSWKAPLLMIAAVSCWCSSSQRSTLRD